jgi:hypothetical protein
MTDPSNAIKLANLVIKWSNAINAEDNGNIVRPSAAELQHQALKIATQITKAK